MSNELQPFFSPNENHNPEVVLSSPDRLSTAASLRLQLERFRKALLKRWWIIAACLLLIGAPAVIYAYLRPPVFKSQAIMWLTSRFNLPGGERLFSEEMSSYTNTQAELMRS